MCARRRRGHLSSELLTARDRRRREKGKERGKVETRVESASYSCGREESGIVRTYTWTLDPALDERSRGEYQFCLSSNLNGSADCPVNRFGGSVKSEGSVRR